jgi:nicotinamidase-related amidase
LRPSSWSVEPLKSLVLTQPVAKTKFSMLVPEVDERLDQLKAARFTDTVVLCDIETHVCVVATCIDLIHRGYNVVADAVSSRTMTDQKFALERMKVIGAHVTTTEAIVLAMVADAAHPHFKAIQKLIKDLTPDTELV